MPRLAVGCTTNAHRLYLLFMSRLSACIFEWDAADLARLCEAKEQQFRAQGLSLPTGNIHKHPSREELTLHCQRRTGGEETTVQLVEELLHTLMGSRQTGQALQDMHPDSEETAQLIEEHDVVKDDLSDLPEDPTVVLEPSLAPTATVTTSVVSSPAPWTPTITITAPKPSTPVAPSTTTPRSSMAANPSALHTSTPATTSVAADEDVVVDDKNRPGYQHVDSLGKYLVELQEQTVLFLNPQQTDTIISLWQNLHDYDKQQTPTMTTNIYQAGQVPSIRSPQRGGEGNGRTAGATEKVIRTFRGILNKLTPEMFESLMKQVDELNIDTEETLNAVVELIVNKALSEQSYSATYAKMCHHLKGLMVSSQSSNDFVLLHKRLLTRCQMEFQNCGLLTQKEKDVSVQEDLEQTRHKTRVRLLGTVRFIGELFKLKMIWEPIIHTCIGKLLQDECEDSLECVCKLLSTVGKDLDTGTERPKLDSYCSNICNLLKEQKMSSRIKFMLQDVVALRKNNWVPRRKDEGPKTIQQLHQEVKQAEERDAPVEEVEHKTTRKGGSSKPLSELFAKEEAPVNGGMVDCNEEEVYQALKRLLQNNSVNDQLEEWIQNTLNNRQRSSDGFVRALMRAVCQSVIVDCGVYTLNTYELLDRASLLKRFIKDDHKQLVALNVVQQLVVHIDQPDGLLRMFFDVLWDEEVIQDETFFKWRSSSVNVTSVTNFFKWLQEANRRIN
ncbi:eukaryotic translation initiation factor 4 gamma 3-like [Takifugu flavidus]|uniref:eukaryotic translation initiation factor 4 gamma 3-like n=1 Tax=Takifugu flavidus TaxID=433684 RepID=UPI002544BBF3|nr:eukaryotic translation initiation factor 4 gamma 3-like [Takifugu flavidus]